MIVGLTGKSCAGKDLFASFLPADRFSVIDVDALGHDALLMNRDRLVEAFGPSVRGSDGNIDRKVLGPIVFSDPGKLEKLNSITHPWMVREALSRAESAEKEGLIAVINAAVLERMGFVEHCDAVILVIAPYEKRLERALMRDGLTEEAFKARSDAQKDIGESLFSSGKRVITIVNDKDDGELRRQAEFLSASL